MFVEEKPRPAISRIPISMFAHSWQGITVGLAATAFVLLELNNRTGLIILYWLAVVVAIINPFIAVLSIIWLGLKEKSDILAQPGKRYPPIRLFIWIFGSILVGIVVAFVSIILLALAGNP
ncbi:MAG: hypothetical protein HZB70_03140 [Candidatus Berkelbacteria bacterium]|nr:MAG: hypothetical protein HZB70_03140 [Candidatus Berkelbacteria bacterium]QQG51704.1 MAG: hypothetical protein HY845_04050 [Candidatus Berkelbacteria bacterium]